MCFLVMATVTTACTGRPGPATARAPAMISLPRSGHRPRRCRRPRRGVDRSGSPHERGGRRPDRRTFAGRRRVRGTARRCRRPRRVQRRPTAPAGARITKQLNAPAPSGAGVALAYHDDRRSIPSQDADTRDPNAIDIISSATPTIHRPRLDRRLASPRAISPTGQLTPLGRYGQRMQRLPPGISRGVLEPAGEGGLAAAVSGIRCA
jgi:hypothetical protein